MPYAGELAALATAGCWVATALAFEAAGRRIGSLTVNIVRLVMAVGLLALAGWAMRGLPFPTDASAHAWLWLSVSGLVGFTFGDLCIFRAFVVLGSRLSTLMMSLAPPITALIGWLVLGETLGALDLTAMAMIVGGIAWAVLDREKRRPGGGGDGGDGGGTEAGGGGAQATAPEALAGEPPPGGDGGTGGRASRAVRLGGSTSRTWGVLLGIGGAVGQAGGLVLSKFGMADYDPFASTQIRVIAGLVGYMVLFTAVGWWRRVPAALGDRRAMGYTTVGAFFGPFLGVSLSLVSVQLIPTGIAASLMATTPVLIIPVVVFSGQERVGLGGVLGAVLAVAGVALLFMG